MSKIEFLVLACSYKDHNRCVAGIDLTNKRLIRIISNNSTINYSIPVSWCGCEGIELSLMNVYEIEIISKADNLGAQTENYIVNEGFAKRLIRKGSEEDLDEYLLFNSYPFGNSHSFIGTYYYDKYEYSLCLVRCYNFDINYKLDKNNMERPRASFNIYINNQAVRLSDYAVTDPFYREKEHISKAYLLISLPGGLGKGFSCYPKFIAGIITANKTVIHKKHKVESVSLDELIKELREQK